MTANKLIEASAGTGKTQALAEQLIALVKGGLEPHEIVALTFSRAAAGEIFERFVSLLAERAERRRAIRRLAHGVALARKRRLHGTAYYEVVFGDKDFKTARHDQEASPRDPSTGWNSPQSTQWRRVYRTPPAVCAPSEGRHSGRVP